MTRRITQPRERYLGAIIDRVSWDIFELHAPHTSPLDSGALTPPEPSSTIASNDLDGSTPLSPNAAEAVHKYKKQQLTQTHPSKSSAVPIMTIGPSGIGGPYQKEIYE
jgi:hypothetical protein